MSTEWLLICSCVGVSVYPASMRRWRSSPSEQALGSLNCESIERAQVLEDLLRRNVEDIFRVERQEMRGSTFGWGGTLLVDPARALALLEVREPHPVCLDCRVSAHGPRA